MKREWRLTINAPTWEEELVYVTDDPEHAWLVEKVWRDLGRVLKGLTIVVERREVTAWREQ